MPNYCKKFTYPFLESIRLHEGEMELLALHQARVDKTRRLIYGVKKRLFIREVVDSLDIPRKGLYKVRLTYGRAFGTIEIMPYVVKEIRGLILRETKREYGLKRVERGWLDSPVKAFENGFYPLFHSEGRIRDTNYCNIAFHNGSAWHTPLYPLLNGLRRQNLIASEVIFPKDLFIEDLPRYQTIKIFNAMIPFEEAPKIAISDIRQKQE